MWDNLVKFVDKLEETFPYPDTFEKVWFRGELMYSFGRRFSKHIFSKKRTIIYEEDFKLNEKLKEL